MAYEDSYHEDEGFWDHDDEPDLDFMTEHDTAMDSIGWGDDDGGDLAPAWDVL